MFLEERVEQLENLSVDQGRQLESIARGLANLTLDVRAIRQDQNEGFKRINGEFAKVNGEFAKVNAEFAKVNKRLDDHDQKFAELQTTVNDLQTSLNDVKVTLQLVVKLLTER